MGKWKKKHPKMPKKKRWKVPEGKNWSLCFLDTVMIGGCQFRYQEGVRGERGVSPPGPGGVRTPLLLSGVVDSSGFAGPPPSNPLLPKVKQPEKSEPLENGRGGGGGKGRPPPPSYTYLYASYLLTYILIPILLSYSIIHHLCFPGFPFGTQA